MPYITPRLLGFYSNVTPLFDIPKNCIWAHIQYNELCPDVGNRGYGALVYCWTKDGDCQEGWCGAAFILPGQYTETEYFKKTKKEGKVPSFYIRDDIDTTITLSDGRKKVLTIGDYVSVLNMEGQSK